MNWGIARCWRSRRATCRGSAKSGPTRRSSSSPSCCPRDRAGDRHRPGARGVEAGTAVDVEGVRPRLDAGRGQRACAARWWSPKSALAVVLTLGAGLLLRSFLSVLADRSGLPARQPADAADALPQQLPDTGSAPRAVCRRCSRGSTRCPGVTASGGTTRLPLGSTNVTTKSGRRRARAAARRMAGSGVPPRRARLLQGDGDPGRCAAAASTRSDGPTAPPVIVINQTMARQLFANEDPVGKRVDGTGTGHGATPWSRSSA